MSITTREQSCENQNSNIFSRNDSLESENIHEGKGQGRGGAGKGSCAVQAHPATDVQIMANAIYIVLIIIKVQMRRTEGCSTKLGRMIPREQ